MLAVVDHRDLVAKVRYGLTVSGHGLQAVIGIHMEEQGGDIGGGRRGPAAKATASSRQRDTVVRCGMETFPFNGRRPAAGAGP